MRLVIWSGLILALGGVGTYFLVNRKGDAQAEQGNTIKLDPIEREGSTMLPLDPKAVAEAINASDIAKLKHTQIHTSGNTRSTRIVTLDEFNNNRTYVKPSVMRTSMRLV